MSRKESKKTQWLQKSNGSLLKDLHLEKLELQLNFQSHVLKLTSWHHLHTFAFASDTLPPSSSTSPPNSNQLQTAK